MTKLIKVSSLKPGDLVDLGNDPFADPDNNPLLECEYVEVAEVEQETPSCTAVTFEGFDMVGFPTDHPVPVA